MDDAGASMASATLRCYWAVRAGLDLQLFRASAVRASAARASAGSSLRAAARSGSRFEQLELACKVECKILDPRS